MKILAKKQCILFSTILLIHLTSCSSTSPQQNSQPLQTASVSSYYQKISIPKGTTFSVNGISLGGTRSVDLDMNEINEIIKNNLAKVMIEKGYQQGTRGNSFLTLEYFVAMENEITEAALNKRFDISAGIPDSTSSTKYPKGTLFVDIIHTRTKALLWRGSVQAYGDITAGKAQREVRTYSIIRNVLSSFE